MSGSGEGQQTLGGEGGVGGNEINARGDSPGPDALRRVEKANNSRKNQEGDHNRTPDQYNPDTDCGAIKTNDEHCQSMLVACGLHGVEVQRAVPRNPPFANNFSELYCLQLVHQLAELLGPEPSEPQETLQPHQSTQLMQSDQGMKEPSIQHGLVANGVARSEVTDERVLDGSGYLQQASGGEAALALTRRICWKAVMMLLLPLQVSLRAETLTPLLRTTLLQQLHPRLLEAPRVRCRCTQATTSISFPQHRRQRSLEET